MLVRPPLRDNGTENGGYTSLIKGKKASEKADITAEKSE